MLLEHYKFAAQTFGVTPDPAFLFLSPTHREAMATVLQGVLCGRGFTALIAEPGMGKTTLLFNLLHVLKATAKTSFLFQTPGGPKEFLGALLADVGIEDDGSDFTRMHLKLNALLLSGAQQGRHLVVVIDEAQNLDESVLEVVRMLSNFETANKKLMQVVLAGQPQLAEKLNSGSLTQLRQRISMIARLTPFNSAETRAYIEHRLRLAGFASDHTLFTEQAYALIAGHAHGIPRNINNLCFNAISLACALERRTVNASIVQEAIDDLDLRTLLPKSVKARIGRVGERSRPLLPFRSSAMFSSSKSRLRVVLAAVLLVLLGWPAYRASEFARRQSLLENPGTASQVQTNNASEKRVEAAATLSLNARKREFPQLTTDRASVPARIKPLVASAIKTGQRPHAEIEILVKPNQTLLGIGMMYTGRHDNQIVSDIYELNPWLKDPKRLRPGQLVKIPVENLQVAREIQYVLEQNEATHEFAEKR